MAIKSAKEEFTKEDVIEILRRNVALYKDEREFVEYIVELATYLIDRHYGEERISSEAMPLPPGMRGSKKQESAPAPGASGSLTGKDLPPRVSDLRGQARRTESGSFLPPSFGPEESRPKHDEEPASPAPPSSGEQQPQVPASPEPQSDPPSGRLHFIREEHRDPAAEAHEEPPPPPSNTGERRKTTVNVSRLGRARVYKVVRPYKVSTSAQVPCPVCGDKVPMGERQCPCCGHLL